MAPGQRGLPMAASVRPRQRGGGPPGPWKNRAGGMLEGRSAGFKLALHRKDLAIASGRGSPPTGWSLPIGERCADRKTP